MAGALYRHKKPRQAVLPGNFDLLRALSRSRSFAPLCNFMCCALRAMAAVLAADFEVLCNMAIHTAAVLSHPPPLHLIHWAAPPEPPAPPALASLRFSLIDPLHAAWHAPAP